MTTTSIRSRRIVHPSDRSLFFSSPTLTRQGNQTKFQADEPHIRKITAHRLNVFFKPAAGKKPSLETQGLLEVQPNAIGNPLVFSSTCAVRLTSLLDA